MPEKRFIPFSEIKNHEDDVLVVDAHHPQGFTLSHWRGASVPAGCEGDTSTEIVLQAIEKDLPALDKPYVTNNHYDIDGFLGVWSLFNPELALQNKDLLVEIAQIGDFREINFEYAEWKKALKIACWLNKVEADRFYPPFGAPEVEAKEIEACVPKYNYFLEVFEAILTQPITHIENTQEYQEVLKDLEKITKVETDVDLRLQIVHASSPIHYYALYSRSKNVDIVLSVYPENRYELEYKYTTWVQTTRLHYPRLRLDLLCEQLNKLETKELNWEAENFTDTAPILRLKGKKLSKKERFQSPSARPIYTSGIDKHTFIKAVKDYFQYHYKKLKPGETLPWKTIKTINKDLVS